MVGPNFAMRAPAIFAVMLLLAGSAYACSLTVTKVVVNDNGGTAVVSDFILKVNNTVVASGVPHTFSPGTYIITETGPSGYAASYPSSCPGGVITLTGSSKTCTITNNDVPQSGCTYTQGYWKTHSVYGPATPADPNWYNLGALGPDTIFFLSGQTYYQVFGTPIGGNPYYKLAYQYMAAELNILSGASDSSVAAEMASAKALFEAYTPAQADGATGYVKGQFNSLADTLADYNEGTIGPGHCEEQAASTIVATKIICGSESDLPNWGNYGPSITSSTVTNFLSSHPNCQPAPGWKFQWGNENVANPGDNTGEATTGWNTFGPTAANGVASVTVPTNGVSKIWAREVWQNGYIPFTGKNTNQPVSAEMYCADDVLHYDNYDFISNPQDGHTYYCVAFNVPACTPTTETCNGVDDDCDGAIDEGLTTQSFCGVGICSATGENQCVEGVMVDTCQEEAPGIETCNLLDDDCDGAVDEGLTTQSFCGIGVCSATGENQCVEGVMVDTCTVGTAGTEICNGLDDDCNGLVDEDDVCLLVCNPSVELVSNGGFEVPPVASGTWNIFNNGTAGLVWNVQWMSPAGIVYKNTTIPAIPKLELQRGYSGPAATGMQYAELDSDWDGPGGSLSGEPASVKISQAISTVPGEEYTLKFDFSPRPNTNTADNILQASINGQVVKNVSRAGSSTTNWTEHSYSFVADSSTTTLQFADIGAPNSLGTLLDDVSLKCTLPDTAHLAVIKTFINVNSGAAISVALYINGTQVANNTPIELSPGTYFVSEDQLPGYRGTIGGDCATDGSITLAAGDSKVCTITNEYVGVCVLVPSADLNGDLKIDSVELMIYINKWKAGEVTSINLMKAINFWKAGVGC